MLTITPLPRPTCAWSSPWSPKKNLNHGSLLRGLRRAALLVLMLTTAGEAFLAAALRLPGAIVLLAPPGASITDTTPPSEVARLLIHSGLRVPTTNQAASRTVTACANSSQMRFMMGNSG